MNIKKIGKCFATVSASIAIICLLAACQKETAETPLIESRSSESSVAMVESSSKESQQKDFPVLKSRKSDQVLSAASLGEANEDVVGEEPVEEPMEEATLEEETVVQEVENMDPIAEEEPVYQEEPVYEEPVHEEVEPEEPVYTYEVTYEEFVIPIPTQYVGDSQRDNDSMPIILQNGQAGKGTHTWMHTYEDGVLIDSHITKTSQVDPIPEKISIGINIVVIPEGSSYEQELTKMKQLFPGAFD